LPSFGAHGIALFTLGYVQTRQALSRPHHPLKPSSMQTQATHAGVFTRKDRTARHHMHTTAWRLYSYPTHDTWHAHLGAPAVSDLVHKNNELGRQAFMMESKSARTADSSTHERDLLDCVCDQPIDSACSSDLDYCHCCRCCHSGWGASLRSRAARRCCPAR
jgi:hypothetical protein